MEHKTSSVQPDKFITHDYCQKCSQYNQSQIDGFQKLVDEKFKSIRNQIVIAVTTTSTILGIIQVVLQYIPKGA